MSNLEPMFEFFFFFFGFCALVFFIIYGAMVLQEKALKLEKERKK